jgi:hypothetical protein
VEVVAWDVPDARVDELALPGDEAVENLVGKT